MFSSKRIFLSYSYSDKEQAIRIIDELNLNGLQVISDESDYAFGKVISEKVFNSLEYGDVFILLLSKNMRNSRSFSAEFKEFINKKLNPRDITIIPVVLSSIRLPKFLNHLIKFNMRINFDVQLNNLVKYLTQIRFIDFNILDYYRFEQLIFALLKRLKLKDVHLIDSKTDFGYDIEAVSRHKDPFGGYVETKWVITVKLYKHSRADISSLNNMSHIVYNLPRDYNGVIITNGQLTSSAKDWLYYNEKENRPNITIIDGVKLKELILRYPDLVNEFFGNGGE